MGADKGRSTVITAKDEYKEKVKNMLSDDKTYEKLKADPTAKFKRKLVGTLQRLKGGRMGCSDTVSLWSVSLLVNTGFRFFILE